MTANDTLTRGAGELLAVVTLLWLGLLYALLCSFYPTPPLLLHPDISTLFLALQLL